MQGLSEAKQKNLQLILFKCKYRECGHRLTYVELLLGTHEEADCGYMRVLCDGCGANIYRKDWIRHGAIECTDPKCRCPQCQDLVSLKDEAAHREKCGLKAA